MKIFPVAHVAAEDWAHAAKACTDRLADLPPEANLGFVYATDELAEDFSSILTYLRQKTHIDHWVGSVGMGISAGATEYFDCPALAVMAAQVAEESFRVVPSISESTDQLSEDLKDWIGRSSPVFGMVHGDPNNPKTPELIDDLARITSGFLVGGLTSSRSSCHQVADRITGGGLSGILFSPEVEVATGLSQGCQPLAESHVISDCLDNVIIGLDGERALGVFKQDIGETLATDLSQVAGQIHAALPIEGSDTGDYLVRDLVGIDTARGWLAIAGAIEPGDRVLFVRRDPETAARDLTEQMDKLKRRLPHPPKGGIYVSCIARGPNMFEEAGRELALVREGLGDFPLVGFSAGGEISNSRLYAYTGVLTLFL